MHYDVQSVIVHAITDMNLTFRPLGYLSGAVKSPSFMVVSWIAPTDTGTSSDDLADIGECMVCYSQNGLTGIELRTGANAGLTSVRRTNTIVTIENQTTDTTCYCVLTLNSIAGWESQPMAEQSIPVKQTREVDGTGRLGGRSDTRISISIGDRININWDSELSPISYAVLPSPRLLVSSPPLRYSE